MGRVLTNNVSISYAIETSLGVAGTTWYLVEPNDISTFGASITTVARDPISRNRQRRKGVVTDLDSTVEFDEDTTLSSFRDFIEGYCFATGINSDVSELITTAAATTGDTYTISALDAAQAEKFETTSLIYVTGFATAANNGLKSIGTDAADTDTTLSVNENLVDETAPAGARISFSGNRVASASAVTWTWDSPNNQATMSFTGLGTLLIQLGLTVGQSVHIGSPDGSGGFENAFENATTNDMFGYARVVSISANDIVFDKTDVALQCLSEMWPLMTRTSWSGPSSLRVNFLISILGELLSFSMPSAISVIRQLSVSRLQTRPRSRMASLVLTQRTQ